MSKYFKTLSTLIFVLSMALISACASTDQKEGMGEYVDDSVITTRVKAAILGEESLSVAEINVETFKGVVQLSGFVNSTEDRIKAIEVAQGISGVISVENSMVLK